MENRHKIEEVLKNYGLSTEEIKTYLAMLIRDCATILKIAKETGIKRSTVYLVIDKLINKNLVKVAIVGKKKSYFAEDPKILLEQIEHRKHELEKIIPLLKEEFRTNKEKPRVRYYQGRDGVVQVYNEITNSKTTKDILWISSQQEMVEEFGRSNDLLEDSSREYYPIIKIIVNPTKFDREYAKKINLATHHHSVEARIMPKHLLFMHTDNCIFENKLAIFSIKLDYFAIVIESADIANTYRAIFEMAWESALKP